MDAVQRSIMLPQQQYAMMAPGSIDSATLCPPDSAGFVEPMMCPVNASIGYELSSDARVFAYHLQDQTPHTFGEAAFPTPLPSASFPMQPWPTVSSGPMTATIHDNYAAMPTPLMHSFPIQQHQMGSPTYGQGPDQPPNEHIAYPAVVDLQSWPCAVSPNASVVVDPATGQITPVSSSFPPTGFTSLQPMPSSSLSCSPETLPLSPVQQVFMPVTTPSPQQQVFMPVTTPSPQQQVLMAAAAPSPQQQVFMAAAAPSPQQQVFMAAAAPSPQQQALMAVAAPSTRQQVSVPVTGRKSRRQTHETRTHQPPTISKQRRRPKPLPLSDLKNHNTGILHRLHHEHNANWEVIKRHYTDSTGDEARTETLQMRLSRWREKSIVWKPEDDAALLSARALVKKDIWKSVAKVMADLGRPGWTGSLCRKRWEEQEAAFAAAQAASGVPAERPLQQSDAIAQPQPLRWHQPF